MDQSPSPALVAHVQEMINSFFEISPEEARRRAIGIVLLAEGWGSLETATKLDWAYRVKKDFGNELKWRSSSLKAEFDRDEKARFEAIKMLVPDRVVKPFGN